MLMRWRGRAPWPKNPDYCGACFQLLDRYHGGAEIESSFLFADIRGSTTLAEGISPTAFRTLLDRFYDVAARVLVAHDGIVDKFVGDEVVGIFIPALAHDEHPARAIAAARALLDATGHADPGGPWLPMGVGVATGTAFVGSVGETHTAAMTALGDIVNVTARLASAAGPGEILVNDRAAERAGLETGSLELRRLELKGKTQPTRSTSSMPEVRSHPVHGIPAGVPVLIRRSYQVASSEGVIPISPQPDPDVPLRVPRRRQRRASPRPIASASVRTRGARSPDHRSGRRSPRKGSVRTTPGGRRPSFDSVRHGRSQPLPHTARSASPDHQSSGRLSRSCSRR